MSSVRLDSALCTATGGTATRTIGDRFADVVNVKDFGAKGDGTTDDTAAIEAAVAAVQASGGTLLFPGGTYSITVIDNLGTTSKRVRLQGVGNATIQTNGKVAFHVAASSTGLTIEGLRFVTTETSATGVHGLIRIDGAQTVTDLVIRDCEFTGATSATNGIKAVFTTDGYSLSGMEVSGCRFLSIGRIGIEVINHTHDGTYRYEDVRIIGNRFDSLGNAETLYGQAVSLSGRGQNNVVANNTIQGARGYALEFIGADHLSVVGNTIRDSGTAYPILVNRAGSGALANTTDISIVGNTIDAGGPLSIQYTSGATITGNTLRGTGYFTPQDSDHLVVAGNDVAVTNQNIINRVDSSNFSGNRFASYTDASGYYLLVQDSDLNVFSGNTITSENGYALRFAGASAGNFVTGGQISNEAAATGISALRFDGASVTGNYVVGVSFRWSTGGGGVSWAQGSGASGNYVNLTSDPTNDTGSGVNIKKQILTATGSNLAINAANGAYIEMTPADANAFTFAAPTNGVDGEVLTFSIRNATACNAGDPFPTANGWRPSTTAWAAPGASNGKTLQFIYRISNNQWIQIAEAVEYVL